MTGASLPPTRRAWLRWAPTLALAGLALAVILPGLGAPGLWEPQEREVARAAARAALAPAEGHAPLVPGAAFRSLLPRLGLSWWGGSETAARLPGALAALVAVGLVAAAGIALVGRRAGLYGACLLLTMPAFVLGARQLTSETPLLAALTLTLGGLGGFVVAAGARRWVLLALGGLGLALGTLTGGLLVGAVGPALALALAFHPIRSSASDRGAPEGRLSVRLVVGALGAAALVALALSLVLPHAAGALSWRLGGRPQLTGGGDFAAVLRAFGFATFPWGALALFALLRPLVDDDQTASPDGARQRFAERFLLLAAALGLALATMRLQLTGETTVAFLPAAALAMGRFLDQQAQSWDLPGNGLLALLIAVGAIIVARDLGQAPAELLAAALGTKPTWPVTLEVRGPLLAVGLAAALAMLALVARPGAGWPATTGAPARSLARFRRAAPALLLAIGALQALWMSHRLLPELGRHLSPKRLFSTFERLRTPGGRLAIYAGATEEPPWGAATTAIATLPALADTLGSPEHRFAVVPRGELGRIDRHLADRGISYAVAEASSSRLLLLANRLPPGQRDLNPLAPLRWRPTGGGPRPWAPPQRSLQATFGEAIELRGADLPAKVHRLGGLPLTLHLRALRTPPPDHQIFVHLERPGTLLNGDHHPLQGIFPTTLWAPGDELRDSHQVPLPLVVAPAGTYRVLVGFWPGGNTERRLPVTAGDHDGRDRVFVGTVEVR